MLVKAAGLGRPEWWGGGVTKPERLELRVPPERAGERLDRWLADAGPGLSRSRVQALMEDGCVTDAGGAVTSAARRVKAGESYVLLVPPPAPALPEPEDIPLDVLYEDADLIVIHKPVGLVVHPAPGHRSGTLVNALLHHCRESLSGIGGVTRPGIVHRLDMDTSGVMVAAKSDLAHRRLVELFQAHDIERAYKAVVWGVPKPPKGRIETLIGRDHKDRKRMAVVGSGGRRAVTDYAFERAVGSGWSLVDCRLLTGRTHQIRVHMASIGHPVAGDPVYARRKPQIKNADGTPIHHKGQALHAYLLGFVHPISGKPLRFEIALSLQIINLIDSLDRI